MERYTVVCISFQDEEICYVNDTLVADGEPHGLVCEASKDYAAMICDLLNDRNCES